MTHTAQAVQVASRRSLVFGGGGALALLIAVLACIGAWHLSQGTSGTGGGDLLAVLTGGGTEDARNVLLGSRLPRLAAGVAVGVALGVAGVLMQTLARNPLASPDTLGVTAGSYLAVTAVAAFGIAVPLWASGLLAFGGGLAAAGIVLGLAGGAGTSSTRLVLAGSALALAFQALTSTLLILFQEETKGLLSSSAHLRHEVKIDIGSRLAEAVRVEVRERVPLRDEGEKEDLDLTITRVEPPWEEFAQTELAPTPLRGGKRWRFELGPGEDKRLVYSYVVKIGAKHELVGGNRRE